MSGNIKDPPASSGIGRSRLFRAFLAVGFASLIWSISWYLAVSAPPIKDVSPGDRADILFGASAIALMLFSLVIALLALVGWGELKSQINEKIELALERRFKRHEQELRGRILSGLGFMAGELSTAPGKLEPENRDRLAMAVELCRAGYKNLQGLGDGPRLNGLNNLVFYESILGEEHRGAYLLEEARELRNHGLKTDAARLLLTYCRVVLRYAKPSSEDWEQARVIAEGLKKSSLPDHERKEAELYSTSFADQFEAD